MHLLFTVLKSLPLQTLLFMLSDEETPLVNPIGLQVLCKRFKTRAYQRMVRYEYFLDFGRQCLVVMYFILNFLDHFYWSQTKDRYSSNIRI